MRRTIMLDTAARCDRSSCDRSGRCPDTALGRVARLAAGADAARAMARLASFLIATVLFIGCDSTGTPSSASSGKGRRQLDRATTALRSASVVPESPTPSASASAFAGLRLVAVGDWIASPYGGQDCSCPGFPSLFGDWIEKSTGMPVDVKNLSQHDNNTAAPDGGRAAEQARPPRCPAAADIITLTIGHNDTPWNAN